MSNTKIIDGRRYEHAFRSSKSEAKRQAIRRRKLGYKARVISNGDGSWSVWVRR